MFVKWLEILIHGVHLIMQAQLAVLAPIVNAAILINGYG